MNVYKKNLTHFKYDLKLYMFYIIFLISKTKNKKIFPNEYLIKISIYLSSCYKLPHPLTTGSEWESRVGNALWKKIRHALLKLVRRAFPPKQVHMSSLISKVEYVILLFLSLSFE